MRGQEDKINYNFNPHWPNLFNVVIEHLELKEIEMMGQQFTWANILDPPIFEKLDRVLMSQEWELKFPKITVEALDKSHSNHTLMLFNGSVSSQSDNHVLVKFELRWVIRDSFHEMVLQFGNKKRGVTLP
jgi:hypothetical protein